MFCGAETKDLVEIHEFMCEEALVEVALLLAELFAHYGTNIPHAVVFKVSCLQQAV